MERERERKREGRKRERESETERARALGCTTKGPLCQRQAQPGSEEGGG